MATALTIATVTSTSELGQEEFLRVSRIRPRKDQPREYFDPAKLEHLALSIETIKQKTAIEVRRISGDANADFEIIEGERRYRVFVTRGWELIKAIVKNPESDDQAWEDSFVANACREGYTPQEILKAAERLKATRGWSNEKIAAALGRSEPWLYQYLRLRELPDSVLQLMNPGRSDAQRLKIQVAGVLTKIKGDDGLQLSLAEEVCQKKMSVSEALAYIKRKAFDKGHKVGTMAGSPNKDFRRLEGFTLRIPTQVKTFVDMPGTRFHDMFKERSQQEALSLVARLDTAIEELQAIRKVIDRIAQPKQTPPSNPLVNPPLRKRA